MGTSAMIAQGIAPQPGGVLLGNVAYIPPGLEGYYKTPFTYVAVFPNLVANTPTEVAVNIENDSYFVCVEQTLDIWDAATGNTTQIQPTDWAATARIKDSSSGAYQQNQPVPVSSLFGTAERPFVYLYRAKLYNPGGQLTLELTNRLAVAQTVRACFSGFKVYKYPEQQITP